MDLRKKQIAGSAVFLVILCFLVLQLQGIFGLDEKHSYDVEEGFTREKRDTLDAVYIGGSDVHYYWQPLFGWKDHGIATWNYSIDAIPIQAVTPLMKEARKTQPDALYLVSLSTFKKSAEDIDLYNIHRVIDYMPFSMNKLYLIHRLADASGAGFWDRVEFYFPVVRFHKRWMELGSWIFRSEVAEFKSSYDTERFTGVVKNIDSDLEDDGQTAEVSEDVMEIMCELLDYCDANDVRVLFVKVPQWTTEAEKGQMNALEQYVGERGYTCLDIMEKAADLHLYPATDFFNAKHTNVHGSLKISEYLGNYLVDHYHFDDKRSDPEWQDWDKAASAYTQFLSTYVLPFEFDHAERNNLTIPVLNETLVDGQRVTLQWEESEGAEGYEVYRKCVSGKKASDHNWEKLGEMSAEITTFTDDGLNPASNYSYTVVPFQDTEESRVYGMFDVLGVSAVTEDEAK